MIKTLRITSMVAAALGLVFLVCSVVFGIQGDSEVEKFLASASVVDIFKDAGVREPGATDKISPLVAMAEQYGLFLDPPPPVRPKPPKGGNAARPVAETPVAPTPKFRLIGISYYEANPSDSLAFVDEVGSGAHWVRTAGMVGRITIEAIKEDSIVVNDGTKSYEMTADSAPAAVVTATSPLAGRPHRRFPRVWAYPAAARRARSASRRFRRLPEQRRPERRRRGLLVRLRLSVRSRRRRWKRL